MLFRSTGKVLTVEKQMTDSKDTLNRLERIMRKRNPTRIQKIRVGLRPALKITFATTKEARDAEEWVEREFDV